MPIKSYLSCLHFLHQLKRWKRFLCWTERTKDDFKECKKIHQRVSLHSRVFFRLFVGCLTLISHLSNKWSFLYIIFSRWILHAYSGGDPRGTGLVSRPARNNADPQICVRHGVQQSKSGKEKLSDLIDKVNFPKWKFWLEKGQEKHVSNEFWLKVNRKSFFCEWNDGIFFLWNFVKCL